MTTAILIIIICFMILAIVLLIKFSVDLNWENYQLRKRVKEMEKEIKFYSGR